MAADPAWQAIRRALATIGGFDRWLVYDLPPGEAPRPLAGSRVFVQATPAWRRYLAARRALDDGDLTPILALRRLGDRERRLVVDWGARYANAFLLVEPLDDDYDLTDPAGGPRRSLDAAARALLGGRFPAAAEQASIEAVPALADALRSAYGLWIAWPEPHGDAPAEPVPLAGRGTLRDRLLAALAARYPQESFDTALTELYERERELFGSAVARVRIPFLTRLGLPVLYEPRRVDYALRRLVNEGRAWVFEDGPDPAFYRGPQRPVAERVTDAEFERLVVR